MQVLDPKGAKSSQKSFRPEVQLFRGATITWIIKTFSETLTTPWKNKKFETLEAEWDFLNSAVALELPDRPTDRPIPQKTTFGEV